MASHFLCCAVSALVLSSLSVTDATGNWCGQSWRNSDGQRQNGDKSGQNCFIDGNQSSANMCQGGNNWMCDGGGSDQWGCGGWGWQGLGGMCSGMYGGFDGMYPGMCNGHGGMYNGHGGMCGGHGGMCNGHGGMCNGHGGMCNGFGGMCNGYGMYDGFGGMCNGYGDMMNKMHSGHGNMGPCHGNMGNFQGGNMCNGYNRMGNFNDGNMGHFGGNGMCSGYGNMFQGFMNPAFMNNGMMGGMNGGQNWWNGCGSASGWNSMPPTSPAWSCGGPGTSANQRSAVHRPAPSARSYGTCNPKFNQDHQPSCINNNCMNNKPMDQQHPSSFGHADSGYLTNGNNNCNSFDNSCKGNSNYSRRNNY